MTKILAIKGHTTRGKEVIEIFELLGGKNYYNFNGNHDSSVYYIRNDSSYNNVIDYWEGNYPIDFMIFTLEQFLEKFPYKIGDRVRVPEYESEVCISKMYWDGNEVQYEVVTDEVEWYSAKELLEWNAIDLVERHYAKQCDDMGKTVLKTLFMLGHTLIPNKMDDKLEYEIIDGYEFDRVDNNKIILKPINPKYPKTYDECCEILSIPTYYKLKYSTYEHGYHEYTTSKKLGLLQDKLNILGKLLICRDAYWKIAGEQMGLDEPWEPDWSTEGERKYVIEVYRNNVRTNSQGYSNTILAFPTVEMRDTFFNNFQELIEQCKELL